MNMKTQRTHRRGSELTPAFLNKLGAGAVVVALISSLATLMSPAPAANAAYDEIREGTQTPVQEAGSTSWRPSSSYTQIAQPFVQEETGLLSSVTIQVWDIPSGFDLASASIYEFTPGVGPSPDPILGGVGGSIAYEPLPPVALGDPYAATVTFPDRPLLTAGTHYAIVIDPLSASGENVSFVTYVHWQGGVFSDFDPWQYDSVSDSWAGYSNALYVIFSSKLVTRFGEPEEPTLISSDECGIASEVQIPELEGVTYSQSRDGDIVTVTASPAEGYEFPEDAVTSWEFDVSAAECPQSVTPQEPVLEHANECGVEDKVWTPEVEGVTYSQSRDGDIVTVNASPAEGYEFPEDAVTSWEFDVSAEDCVEPTRTAPDVEETHLAQTGGGSVSMLGAIGGALLLLGGTMLAMRRQRAA